MVACKSEEQGDVCTEAGSCISIDLFWRGNIVRWLFVAGWDAKINLVAVTFALILRLG